MFLWPVITTGLFLLSWISSAREIQLKLSGPRDYRTYASVHASLATNGTLVRGGVGMGAPNVNRVQIEVCAALWVFTQVPYCQCNGDCYGNCPFCDTYRCDCSGFVSYCWQTSQAFSTFTLPEVSYQISQGDLELGDVLINNNPNYAHAVIFAGWTDDTQTYYNAYEEIPPQAHYGSVPYPYWSDYDPSEFIPYRYNNVLEGIFGAYVTESCDSSCMDCLLQSGVNLIGVNLFDPSSGGLCDPIGAANIQAGVGLGGNWMVFTPIIYINPQTAIAGGTNASIQAYEGMYCGDLAQLPSPPLYWVGVSNDPTVQQWSNNCTVNEDLILEALGMIWNYYSDVGVTTDQSAWLAITCENQQDLHQRIDHLRAQRLNARNADATPPSSGSLLLWYTNLDGAANFNDFQPFGPFTAGNVFVKSYGLASMCGVDLALDWCPGI